MKKTKGPRILTFDIETSPISAYVWGLYDQNIALNQITNDWKLMSWAAKWLHEKEVIQYDTQKHTEKDILLPLWILLDTADIVVTQNGKSFDVKKVNAKFLEYGLKPVKPFNQIDTKVLAKKCFKFTSNSLEYMSQKFNIKFKKLKHKQFPGMELWNECLKGNKRAWQEMRVYNKYDVLATEELYKKLVAWDNSINFGVYDYHPICSCGSTVFRLSTKSYTKKNKKCSRYFRCYKCGAGAKSPEAAISKANHAKEFGVCSCGSMKFKKNGFRYTKAGKFRLYICTDCGSAKVSSFNLLKGKKFLR